MNMRRLAGALGLAVLAAVATLPAAAAQEQQTPARPCPKWPQKEDVACYEQRQALLRRLGGLAPLALPVMLLVLLMSMRRKGGGRLEELYPAVEPAAGTKRTRERVVFGTGPSMTRVKVGVDHTYLHVTVVGSLRSGAAFSVPLADVAAEPARFPAMILAPDVIRLTFARDRSLPMLVWPRVFEKLSTASQERLRLAAAGPPR